MCYNLYIITSTVKTLYFAEWGMKCGICNIHSAEDPTSAFLLQNLTPSPDKMHIMEGSYKLNRFSIQLYREYKNGMLSCIKLDEDSASTLRQKSVMVSEICLDMMKFCYTKWAFTVHFKKPQSSPLLLGILKKESLMQSCLVNYKYLFLFIKPNALFSGTIYIKIWAAVLN